MESSSTLLPHKRCRYERCQKPFWPSRLNQAFCTPDCKTRHNNSIARNIRQSTKGIDMALKKNLLILQEFFVTGRTEVTIEELERNGFTYSVHTGMRKAQEGKNMFPVYYNYGLIHIGLNKFKIEKL
jgi:hypothetical protein